MNRVVIDKFRTEHIENVIQMVTRFGVPQDVERFESVDKFKECISNNGLDGRVAIEPNTGNIAGFILFCMGYIWPMDDRRFHKSTEIGYISDIIVNPDFLRKGIGSMLVKAAETACDDGSL